MRPVLECDPCRVQDPAKKIVHLVLKTLYRIRHRLDVEEDLRQAVGLIDGLRLPTWEREAVAEHLVKACRFARSGEEGATRWELRAALVYLTRPQA